MVGISCQGGSPGGLAQSTISVRRTHELKEPLPPQLLAVYTTLSAVTWPSPTPGPQVTGDAHQAFEVLFKVPLRQDDAQENGIDKLPGKSPPPGPPPPRRSPAPAQGPAAAVLTSRKRFQYLSRSYWETVLSHWSLSRKLPLLGPAPPASASRCRLSTCRKHHAAAAAASTAIAGICGAGARGGSEPGGQGGGETPAGGRRPPPPAPPLSGRGISERGQGEP